jgi:Family of unknown function (DUF6510)
MTETSDLRLDGNAIGGLLLELFGVEMTTATGVCGSCGTPDLVARLEVYVQAPGTVVRCAHCHAVVMRVVRGPERTWLDLSGLASIELPT